MPQLQLGDPALAQVAPEIAHGVDGADQRHESRQPNHQRAQGIGTEKSIERGHRAMLSQSCHLQTKANRQCRDDRESQQVKPFPPDAGTSGKAKQPCRQWNKQQER